MYGQSVYWRETMKNGKFLIFEGRVVFVILPTFIHMRLWTLFIAIFTMLVFWWFDRKGVSTDSIVRYLKSRIIGKKRSARGVFEERTAIDFGFESGIYLQNEKIEAMKASAGGKPGLLQKLGLKKQKMSTSRNGVSLTKEGRT